MKKNRTLLLLLSCLFLSAQVSGQDSTGIIEGKAIDQSTGEPLMFANVTLTIDGQAKGAQTDFDGLTISDFLLRLPILGCF